MSTKHISSCAFACIVAALLATNRADAGLSVQFTGTVANGGTSGDPYGIGAQAGDSVSGSFFIDLGASDRNSDPNVGTYRQTLARGLRVTFQTQSSGSVSITDSRYNAIVRNDRLLNNGETADDFIVNQNGGGVVVDGTSRSDAVLNLLFRSDDESLYGDDGLPSTLAATDFDLMRGIFREGPSGGPRVRFRISEITVVESPEPSTLAAGVIGIATLGGCVWLRRRRGARHS